MLRHFAVTVFTAATASSTIVRFLTEAGPWDAALTEGRQNMSGCPMLQRGEYNSWQRYG